MTLWAHVPIYEMVSSLALTRNGAGQRTALFYLLLLDQWLRGRRDLTNRMRSVASERGPMLKQEVDRRSQHILVLPSRLQGERG